MRTLREVYSKYSTSNSLLGGDKGTLHSYIDLYDDLFDSMKLNPVCIFEIGVQFGYSIMMWDEYFTHQDSRIYGVDINTDLIKFKFSDRVTIINGDATQENPQWPDNLDVVIDDGSHRYRDQAASFNLFFGRLKYNGVYIIEDILDINADYNFGRYPSIFDFRRKGKKHDDVLAVYKTHLGIKSL